MDSGRDEGKRWKEKEKERKIGGRVKKEEEKDKD